MAAKKTAKKVATKVAKPTRTAKQIYLETQKNIVELWDLKEGSAVKVIRAPKYEEFGSDSESEDMNVGEVVLVETIHADCIQLEDGYLYSIFALEPAENVAFKLSDEYIALVQSDGSVKVGCQTIPFDLLEKIYDAAQDKQ